jgi:hypothetical protein
MSGVLLLEAPMLRRPRDHRVTLAALLRLQDLRHRSRPQPEGIRHAAAQQRPQVQPEGIGDVGAVRCRSVPFGAMNSSSIVRILPAMALSGWSSLDGHGTIRGKT